jgi:hypothetical protein
VLNRHGKTIHRRWLKKSNKSRRKIILEAWGTNMYSSHRPDFKAIELEDSLGCAHGSEYRESYLWPNINEEDLCRPHSLLMLMSTRGRCHPSTLAGAEQEAHRIGSRLLAFGFSCPLMCLMDVLSDGDETSYGRLYDEQSHPDKYAVLDARPYTGPYDALLILEAQERVLSFLVRCAKVILHDFTDASILQSPTVRFDSTLTTKNAAGYTSRAILASETAYGPPASLDFTQIASIPTARNDDCVDHLWSLREDPGYFEAHMLDYKEHRKELILDALGRQHPVCSPEMKDKFWARVVGYQVAITHYKLEIFADLKARAEELREMQDTYADMLNTPSNLPQPYCDAMKHFCYHLLTAMSSLNLELRDAWSASPAIRRYYQRKEEGNAADLGMRLRRHISFDDDPTRVRIYWLLSRLWAEDDYLSLLGHTNFIDELQRLIESESAKPWTSHHIASIVGELALVGELVHQLGLFQQWAYMDDGVVTKEHHYELMRVYRSGVKPKTTILVGLQDPDSIFGAPGCPTDGKFAYPVGKRRTRENVERMREAEANLDKLWHEIDQFIERNAGKLYGEARKSAASEASPLAGSAVHQLLTEGRTLQRTPKWIEPERGNSQAHITELYVPFSQSFSDNQKPDEQTVRKSPSHPTKEKTKTRKSGNPKIPASDAEAVIPAAEGQVEPLFALNARAFKVFKTVFFTPSTTSMPGELSWTDFLYAMVSLGFVPGRGMGPSGNSAQIQIS